MEYRNSIVANHIQYDIVSIDYLNEIIASNYAEEYRDLGRGVVFLFEGTIYAFDEDGEEISPISNPWLNDLGYTYSELPAIYTVTVNVDGGHSNTDVYVEDRFVANFTSGVHTFDIFDGTSYKLVPHFLQQVATADGYKFKNWQISSTTYTTEVLVRTATANVTVVLYEKLDWKGLVLDPRGESMMICHHNIDYPETASTLQYSSNEGATWSAVPFNEDWESEEAEWVTFNTPIWLRGLNSDGFRRYDAELDDTIGSMIMILPQETGSRTSVKISGRITSLIDNKGYLRDLSEFNNGFSSVFAGCNIDEIDPSVLDVDEVGEECFGILFQETKIMSLPNFHFKHTNKGSHWYMFSTCEYLESVPSDFFEGTPLSDSCFSGMFLNCESLSAAPELPWDYTDVACFASMFLGCSSLTEIPVLHATVIEERAYEAMFKNGTGLTSAYLPEIESVGQSGMESMFEGCTSLTQAPKLTAMDIAEQAYYKMFKGCTSLVTPTELPVKNLAVECYMDMFNGCTSLIKTPVLPANNLVTSCYRNMFSGCTSLTEISPIYARNADGAATAMFYMFSGCTSLTKGHSLKGITSIAVKGTTAPNTIFSYMYNGCTSLTDMVDGPSVTSIPGSGMSHMYDGCTSLVNIKPLPYTSLGTYAYSGMFKNCTSLVQAPALPDTTLANNVYQEMFRGCTSLITAPALPATSGGVSCYEAMFQGCTALSSSPMINIEVLASNACKNMFNACSSLSRVDINTLNHTASNCLNTWLAGVAAQGNLYYNPNVTTAYPTGSTSGIPSGWVGHMFVDAEITDLELIPAPYVEGDITTATLTDEQKIPSSKFTSNSIMVSIGRLVDEDGGGPQDGVFQFDLESTEDNITTFSYNGEVTYVDGDDTSHAAQIAIHINTLNNNQSIEYTLTD